MCGFSFPILIINKLFHFVNHFYFAKGSKLKVFSIFGICKKIAFVFIFYKEMQSKLDKKKLIVGSATINICNIILVEAQKKGFLKK